MRLSDHGLRQLDEAYLQGCTNNAAEQALRHWVIARRLSHGTRTDTGSRAFALLASVIDTCRRRHASSSRYLALLIQHARNGLALPPLPSIPHSDAVDKARKLGFLDEKGIPLKPVDAGRQT